MSMYRKTIFNEDSLLPNCSTLSRRFQRFSRTSILCRFPPSRLKARALQTLWLTSRCNAASTAHQHLAATQFNCLISPWAVQISNAINRDRLQAAMGKRTAVAFSVSDKAAVRATTRHPGLQRSKITVQRLPSNRHRPSDALRRRRNGVRLREISLSDVEQHTTASRLCAMPSSRSDTGQSQAPHRGSADWPGLSSYLWRAAGVDPQVVKLYRRRRGFEFIHHNLGIAHHYIRERLSMQWHITLQMTVMLTSARHAIDHGKPYRIHSLLHALADSGTTIQILCRLRQSHAWTWSRKWPVHSLSPLFAANN